MLVTLPAPPPSQSRSRHYERAALRPLCVRHRVNASIGASRSVASVSRSRRARSTLRALRGDRVIQEASHTSVVHDPLGQPPRTSAASHHAYRLYVDAASPRGPSQSLELAIPRLPGSGCSDVPPGTVPVRFGRAPGYSWPQLSSRSLLRTVLPE